MRTKLLLLLVFISIKANCQLHFDWAKLNSELGAYGDFDISGNIYQTKFSSFSKYTSQGSFVWKKEILGPFQSTTTVNMQQIIVKQNALTIAGPIYISYNNPNDTVDFDPGAGKSVLIATKNYSAFISKYTTDGNFIWAKKIEAVNTNDFVFIKVFVDNSGNVYAAGTFRGTVDFDPRNGVFTLNSATNTGYFAKYDVNGNFIWAKKIDNSEPEGVSVAGLTVDNSNRLSIIGSFKGNTDFDPNAGVVSRTPAGLHDVFLAQYDQNGNFLWVNTIGDAGSSVYLSSLSSDLTNNLYVCGTFSGTVDFDPGEGKNVYTSSTGQDLFAVKYSSAGSFIFSKRLTGSGSGLADAQGNLYLMSSDNNTVLNKYSNTGSLIWTQNLSIPQPQMKLGPNEMILTGQVSGGYVADLDPGPGDYIVVGPERDGISFFAKYLFERTNERFVSEKSQWKYLDNGSNQGTGWRAASYNDGAWKTGVAELGYGDGNESTIVSYGSNASSKYVTTYFRKKINITNPSQYSSFALKLLKDDGAVVYINGAEVLRSNMPGGTVTSSTLASTGLNEPAEATFSSYTIAANKFINGSNTIAVEIHQSSRSSSDLSFNMKLEGTLAPTTNNCAATGTILREYWANVTGDHVNQIPVNTSPTSTSQLTIFEGPSNAGDNYGARIRGYVCPPTSGNYTFWIASNNDAELWLSSSENPSGKIKIASVVGYTNPREWTKYASQKSAAINLTAGTKYYIEALHKEGTNGDHLAVGWQLPNGTQERPIPGSRLSPAGSTPPVTCSSSGTILREYWSNVGGDHVSQIPLNTAPASTSQLSIFEGPVNSGDNYGARIKGFVCPPASGNYTFWIAADDDAELWLSSSENPANKVKIASVTGWTNPREWTKYSSQQSALVNLVAGNKYYIEALHKEATGGDNIAVGWRLPNATLERPIPGSRLSPASSTFRLTEDSLLTDTTVVAEEKALTAEPEAYDFIVYPNPSTGQFTLEYCENNLQENNIVIEVLNSIGQLIFKSTPVLNNSCINEVIELDKNLPAGIYILNVIKEGRKESKRIVLAK